MNSEIEISKEVRSDLIEIIQKFYWEQREEKISEFQANTILDFVLTEIGPLIYNQALKDAHALMTDKIEDLFGLEKRFR